MRSLVSHCWTRPSLGAARLKPVNTSNGTCSSSESNQPRANSMSFQNESQTDFVLTYFSEKSSRGLSAFPYTRRFTHLDSPTQLCRKLTFSRARQHDQFPPRS